MIVQAVGGGQEGWAYRRRRRNPLVEAVNPDDLPDVMVNPDDLDILEFNPDEDDWVDEEWEGPEALDDDDEETLWARILEHRALPETVAGPSVEEVLGWALLAGCLWVLWKAWRASPGPAPASIMV